jgi:Fur family transcriptional regulator, ferric uptake regulator
MVTEKSKTWLEQLSGSGYRITPARKAIVEIMAQSGRALDAQEVFELARMNHPQLGLMSVYRTLEKLEDLNLTQRVHQPSGCHTFVAAPDGHQHILICLDCNRVEYFGGDELNPLFEKISRQKEYQIKEHWLQLFGRCKTCTGTRPS